MNRRWCMFIEIAAAIIMCLAVLLLAAQPQSHCGRDAGATVQWLYCDGVR